MRNKGDSMENQANMFHPRENIIRMNLLCHKIEFDMWQGREACFIIFYNYSC